jgi:hypothetical protein
MRRRIIATLLIAAALDMLCGFTVHAHGRQYSVSKVTQARPKVEIKCQPPTILRKKTRGMQASEKTNARPVDRNFVARARRQPLERDDYPVARQSGSRGWSLVRAARTLPPRLSD